MSKKSAICIATSVPQAEQVVGDLRKVGFSNNDISVLLPDGVSTHDFGQVKKTKAPEGIVAGASAAGMVGGALGWLCGLGLLGTPLGPFIAAGPVVAALEGAALGAGVGGIAGGLIGMGIPEIEATRYEGMIHGGNILISVHTDNSAEVIRAKEIFARAGARSIRATGETKTTLERSERHLTHALS